MNEFPRMMYRTYGYTVVHTDDERKRMIREGWVDRDWKEPEGDSKSPVAVVSAVVPAVAEVVGETEKRRGRPRRNVNRLGE